MRWYEIYITKLYEIKNINNKALTVIEIVKLFKVDINGPINKNKNGKLNGPNANGCYKIKNNVQLFVEILHVNCVDLCICSYV